MASVPDHPQSEEDKTLEAAVQPCILEAPTPLGVVPPPTEEGTDDSVERSLAMVHEAHQKVLAAVLTLEKEIERLNCT